jgi:hypothetical protein
VCLAKDSNVEPNVELKHTQQRKPRKSRELNKTAKKKMGADEVTAGAELAEVYVSKAEEEDSIRVLNYPEMYAKTADTARDVDAVPKAEKRRRHDWYSFFMVFTKFYQVVNGGGDSLWSSSQTDMRISHYYAFSDDALHKRVFTPDGKSHTGVSQLLP